jgi:DNA replication protein DnaC
MNKETIEKMGQMRLYGMQAAFRECTEGMLHAALTTDETVGLIVQNEWDDRRHRAVQRGIRAANFRYVADREGLDLEIDRGIDRNLVDRIFTCGFIERAQDIFITGSTGTGKSYLASAIGHQACLMGHRVSYTSTAKLMSLLKLAKVDGSHLGELSKIEKHELLILDDFGIQPFDASGRAMLMDIVEDRHGKRSTLIASQIPVNKWYDIIGEQTVADAILDRLVHQSLRVELKGESLRKAPIGKVK